jgi:hypothetical protein
MKALVVPEVFMRPDSNPRKTLLLAVFEYPAMLPRKTLFAPIKLLNPDWYPTNILYPPDVFK